MFRKILLLSVVSSAFIFSAIKVCLADAAADLSRAESFVKSGQFSQAEQFCTSIAQNNPGSDSALKAQGKLAVIYIMTQRMPQADAEVDKLISDFKGNPELAAVLYGIANRYKLVKESQRAANLCQRICQEYPASEQSQRLQLDSGKEQAFSLIANGEFQQAEDAVNSMVTAAGSNPAVPATLFKIAREFKESGRYDEAMRVYQKIVQNYPNSELGSKARMGVDKLRIWKLIKAGDVAGAQAGLEKLLKDYKDDDDLAHTVHGVALKLEESGYYAQAKALYGRVKQNYPNEEVADMATVDLKLCDIRAMVGKSPYSTVKAELEKLMNDFSGHRQLPKAVWRIAVEYYQQGMRMEGQDSAEQAGEFYRNAAEVWDIVINRLPRSSSTVEACNYAGICYEKLSEYGKANECYQKVLNSYPAHPMRWNTMFMMGRNYERMKKAGAVPGEQADEKAKAVYEKLLTEYPDCKVSGYAKKFLGR